MADGEDPFLTFAQTTLRYFFAAYISLLFSFSYSVDMQQAICHLSVASDLAITGSLAMPLAIELKMSVIKYSESLYSTCSIKLGKNAAHQIRYLWAGK